MCQACFKPAAYSPLGRISWRKPLIAHFWDPAVNSHLIQKPAKSIVVPRRRTRWLSKPDTVAPKTVLVALKRRNIHTDLFKA